MKQDKKEVKNLSLWQTLSELVSQKEITWQLVSGHSGHPGNERADAIASSFAEGRPLKLYNGHFSKYGINLLSDAYDSEKKEIRDERKSRKNIKAYSYVSFVDGVIRIHATWKECEATVKGRNAKFRKTLDRGDEQKLIQSWKENGGRII